MSDREPVLLKVGMQSAGFADEVTVELKGDESALIAALASAMYLRDDLARVVKLAIMALESPVARDIMKDMFDPD